MDEFFDPEFEKAWMKHVGLCFSHDQNIREDYERQKCIAADAWDWAKKYYAQPPVPAPTTVSVQSVADGLLAEIEPVIASEAMAGNIVKEAHAKGEHVGIRTLRDALLAALAHEQENGDRHE